MHASPERPLPSSQPATMAQRHQPAQLRPWQYGHTLIRVMWSFVRLLRRAIWRAVQHDAFTVAKASAYSSILTLFPALLVLGSVLATFHRGEAYLSEISRAVGKILPAGSATAVAYLRGTSQRSIGLLISASLITLWTASGVMVSWMEGFRNAYQLPKTWGLLKERMIAFGLVIMAGIPMLFATILVAFGTQIETRVIFYVGHAYGPYVLIMWTLIRWTIAILTSIAVLALIYHHAVPRTQPWHTVLPGACLGTAAWFAATMAFGWYLRHYAEYSILYGSLGIAIALLVWMFMVSVIVVVGAEMNAMLFPRCLNLKDRAAKHREPEVYVR